MYRELCFEPSECTECNECRERCPAGIDIPQRLRTVAESFEKQDPDLIEQ